MHIRTYLAALELVNEERARMGLAALDRLPAGRPGHARDCAIARAIPGASVTDVLRTSRGCRRVSPEVIRFIQTFDGAQRPTLAKQVDPCGLVEGGVDDDKGSLVPA